MNEYLVMPSFMFAFLVCGVVIGLTIREQQVRSLRRRLDRELRLNYPTNTRAPWTRRI